MEDKEMPAGTLTDIEERRGYTGDMTHSIKEEVSSPNNALSPSPDS
jgi:hypothetical protein